MLQLWGNKLKSLDLTGMRVSLEMNTSTCPVLENLNMVQCRNCGDVGLDNILQLWGNKLKFLHLCETMISGTGITAA